MYLTGFLLPSLLPTPVRVHRSFPETRFPERASWEIRARDGGLLVFPVKQVLRLLGSALREQKPHLREQGQNSLERWKAWPHMALALWRRMRSVTLDPGAATHWAVSGGVFVSGKARRMELSGWAGPSARSPGAPGWRSNGLPGGVFYSVSQLWQVCHLESALMLLLS